MSPRNFLILAVLTGVFVIAAIVAVTSRYTATTEVEEKLAFPELSSNLNDVGALEIRTGRQSLNLKLEDGRWIVTDKHGYRANTEKINKILANLANLALVERKTARPENFERLELRDPESKDTASRHFIIKDKTGETLASIIAGKDKFDLSSVAYNGVYVRFPGENQTWLARGNLRQQITIREFLDRKILHIPEEDVKVVSITHVDGDKVAVLKNDKADEHFRLTTKPEGREIKSPDTVDKVATAFSELFLEDVKPRDDFKFTGPTSESKVITFGGLIVSLKMQTMTDGNKTEHWAVIEAEATDDATKEAREKAAEISKAVDPWAFRIGDWQVETLRTEMASLLAEEKSGKKAEESKDGSQADGKR